MVQQGELMPAPKETSLLESIQEEHRSISMGGKCSFGEAVKKAPPEDREVLLNALGQYTGTAISNALRKRGIDVKAQAVQRHRRGACNCPDELR